MLIKKIDIDKIIYYSILIFAFTLPLSRASISLFMIVLPLLWLYQGDIKNKIKALLNSKLIIAIILFTIYSALSALWSEDMTKTFRHLRLLLYFFTIFVIATSVKKEQIQSVISAFLYGMFVSEIISYGVFFELWSFKNATVSNPVPFMYHTTYSIFLAFTSILLLNRIVAKHYSLKERIIYIIFFFTITGNLFLTEGRIGQVALIFGIIILSLIHYRISFKAIFLSIFIIISTLFMASSLSDTFNKRVNDSITDVKNISNLNLNGSWGIRVAYYITTYDIVKDNILFGVGLGDYVEETKEILKKDKYNFLSKQTRDFMGTFSPHNQFLMTLLQMGIIGFILLVYMLYQIFKLKINNPEIKELSILFSVVFIVGCMAEPFLKVQFAIALFVLFTSLFISASNEKTYLES